MFHVKHCGTLVLCHAKDMERCAQDFAPQVQHGHVVGLYGPLGAGKTTWVRGFLKFFGYTGVVRSPTYTLVETYSLQNITICHCDFYRLKGAVDLDEFRAHEHAVMLIEWPELIAESLQWKLEFQYGKRQHERRLDMFEAY